MKEPKLHTLPEDHPLRNTPLAGFRSRTYEYRGKGEYDWSLWKVVGDAWPIAKKTYNELGEVWKTKPLSEWKQPKQEN